MYLSESHPNGRFSKKLLLFIKNIHFAFIYLYWLMSLLIIIEKTTQNTTQSDFPVKVIFWRHFLSRIPIGFRFDWYRSKMNFRNEAGIPFAHWYKSREVSSLVLFVIFFKCQFQQLTLNLTRDFLWDKLKLISVFK